MPPGVKHSVYTVAPSVIIGHHFYTHATMAKTEPEHSREHDDPSETNECIPEGYIEIARMAVQWLDPAVREQYVGPGKLFGESAQIDRQRFSG
jgi:hypothetical protein